MITETTAATTPASAGAGSDTGTTSRQISSDFETFLRMLTVQMENQDPLDPIDSADYAVQLATFSSVEQQVQTNELLSALSRQMTTSGLADMAAWVGQEGRVAAAAYFDGSPITIAPIPDGAAVRAELVVRDGTGTVVQREDLPLTAGQMQWAGTDRRGAPLPAGLYTFEVVSYTGDEATSASPVEVYAPITEVRAQDGEIFAIFQGGVEVSATDVAAIRRAQ